MKAPPPFAKPLAAAIEVCAAKYDLRRLVDRGGGIAFFKAPARPVLVVARVRLDEDGTVRLRIELDPLVGSEPNVVAVDPARPIAKLSRPPTADHVDSCKVADAIAVHLERARIRYGDPTTFLAQFDDDYLYDDEPTLAEAVAYLRFRLGDLDRARYQLGMLKDDPNVEGDLASRAGLMLAAIESNPRAAAAEIDQLERNRLKTLGIDAGGPINPTRDSAR